MRIILYNNIAMYDSILFYSLFIAMLLLYLACHGFFKGLLVGIMICHPWNFDFVKLPLYIMIIGVFLWGIILGLQVSVFLTDWSVPLGCAIEEHVPIIFIQFTQPCLHVLYI